MIASSWAWNETSVSMSAEGLPIVMQRNTQEGASSCACGLAVLTDGEGDSDKVYDYLNAVLDARVTDFLVNDWGYGHANAEVADFATTAYWYQSEPHKPFVPLPGRRTEFLLQHGFLDMVVERTELKETLARCLRHLLKKPAKVAQS